MGILSSIVKKLGQILVVVIVVTFLTQLLMRQIPGDIGTILAPFASDQQRENIRQEIGVNDNVFVQYGKWVGTVVDGSFGKRYTGAQSYIEVGPEIRKALPNTLLLILYSQLISLALAIPLGVWSAYRAGRAPDKVISGAGFAFLALPNFALALVLIYFFGVKLKWLPTQHASGDVTLKEMILPSLSLAMGQLAVYMRLLRSDLIATLQQDFISMAKAKGLKPSRILWRHALRPSSLTLLTAAGLQTGALIGGTLVAEVIFGIPGIGLMIINAIGKRQIIELQSLVAVVAVLFVLINFGVDALYRVLDPRIRR